MNTVWK